jgi:hypothetical protein
MLVLLNLLVFLLSLAEQVREVHMLRRSAGASIA